MRQDSPALSEESYLYSARIRFQIVIHKDL